jgi:hypothetical protein
MTVTVMADPNPGAGGLAWVGRGITNDGRTIPYSGFLSNAVVGNEPVMVNVTPDNPEAPGNAVYLVATWDAANKYSRYRVRNDSTRQQTVVITQIW